MIDRIKDLKLGQEADRMHREVQEGYRVAGGFLPYGDPPRLYSQAASRAARSGNQLKVSHTKLPRTLMMALQRRKPPPGLLHHSDRGSQYASHEYRKLLDAHGARQSMSRKGNCWEPAGPAQLQRSGRELLRLDSARFGSMKTELDFGDRDPSREAAKRDLFFDIEGYYNRIRLHSALGDKTPEPILRSIA